MTIFSRIVSSVQTAPVNPPILSWFSVFCILAFLGVCLTLKLLQVSSKSTKHHLRHKVDFTSKDPLLQVGTTTQHQVLLGHRTLASATQPSLGGSSRFKRPAKATDSFSRWQFNRLPSELTLTGRRSQPRPDSPGTIPQHSAGHMHRGQYLSTEERLQELQRLLDRNEKLVDHIPEKLKEAPLSVDRYNALHNVRSWEPDQSAAGAGAHSISLMTYNILADTLAFDHRSERFKHVLARCLRWTHRRRLIVQEVKFYMPQILCFQELQGTAEGGESNHRAWVHKALRQEGYEMLYLRKTRHDGSQSNGVDLGNAICWRANELTLVKRHYLPLATILAKLVQDQPPEAVELWTKHTQVALAAVLRHDKSSREFVVCTTHICCNFKQPWLQLAQVQCILQELTKVCKTSTGDPLPLILAGDFNALPSSAIYQLITTGSVKSMHPDTVIPRELAQAGMKMPNFEPDTTQQLQSKAALNHPLELSSAYRRVLGAEPDFTNVEGASSLGRAPFIGTLDYIFHTGQLQPLQVLRLPSLSLIQKEGNLPSSRFASDHLPLVAIFAMK